MTGSKWFIVLVSAGLVLLMADRLVLTPVGLIARDVMLMGWYSE